MSGKKAVPLCLPDNHIWDSERQCIHINRDAQRRKLELCEEGLNVLKSIDNSVVVICITGPVRSGKSFFLSQIQNGGRFEVHHGTTSNTTGIWITSTEHTVIRNGRPASLVFLDTEGLGSVSTSDNNEDTTWERKLLALSLLLSSYFIFNSQGTPTYDDLMKLGFVSSFSKFIKKDSGKSASSGAAATRQSNSSPPDFLWLVRDETLQPELDNQPCTWSSFLKSEVLKKRGTSSNDDRNQIRKAVINTFGKIDADSLPFPSIDPDVLQLLDSSEGLSKLNPKFSERLQAITTKILRSANVKREAGRVVSGRDLEDLLQAYVKVLNTPDGIIDVESAWECLLAAKDAKQLYYKEMKALNMPCSADGVHACHLNATKKALHLISTKAGRSSSSDVEFYRDKFNTYAEEQMKRRNTNNEQLSRALCRRVKEKVSKAYLKMTNKGEETQFDMKTVQIAKKKTIEEYRKNARGPAKVSVLEELKVLVSNFEISARRMIIENCVNKGITLYKAEMENLQQPTSNDNLDEAHKSASLLAENFFMINARRPSENQQMLSDHRERLLAAIESEKSVIVEQNNNLSLEQCEHLMGSLRDEYLTPVIDDLAIRANLQDLKDAFDQVLECFESRAVGPKVKYVRKMATKDVEILIQQSQSRLLQRGLHKAKECYTQQLNNLILPCSEVDLYKHEKICRRQADQRFWFYVKGIQSDLCKRELENLYWPLKGIFDSRKLENDSISRRGHKERIAQLERRHGLKETLENPWERDRETVGRKHSRILADFKSTAQGTGADEFYEATERGYRETQQQCSNEDTVRKAAIVTGGIMLAVFGLATAFGGSKKK